MTAYSKPYSRLELVLETFTDWLKHRREMNEIRRLDCAEFNRIASDLRVSPGDLDEMVRHGPHAADELPQMLKALGIDEANLASAQPLLLRDMQRVCAMCQSKPECDHDLAAGTAAEHYRDYCLNASTIEELPKSTS